MCVFYLFVKDAHTGLCVLALGGARRLQPQHKPTRKLARPAVPTRRPLEPDEPRVVYGRSGHGAPCLALPPSKKGYPLQRGATRRAATVVY